MGISSDILHTRLVGGRRTETSVRGHLLATDQPTSNGGDDAAPSPYEFFLASIGACAAVTVQGFCAKRGIPVEGIRVEQSLRTTAEGALAAVTLKLVLPPTFPEKYRDAVVRVAEQCSVKRAIAAQPAFELSAEVEAAAPQAAGEAPSLSLGA